jgi:hypothetical protein
MFNTSDETVDSLVMARRMLPSRSKSSSDCPATTKGIKELCRDYTAEENFFTSPKKAAKSENIHTKSDVFLSPHAIIKVDLSAAPKRSPSGVIEEAYKATNVRDAQSPVRSTRRTKSAIITGLSPRRTPLAPKGTLSDKVMTASSQKSASMRSPRRRSTVSPRVHASPSSPACNSPPRRAIGIQALKLGDSPIAFPNFQDSFISCTSSTDHHIGGFHDSVLSLDRLDGENDHFCAEPETKRPSQEFASSSSSSPPPPSPRRQAPVRRRSARKTSTVSSHRADCLKQSSPPLLDPDLAVTVTASPRRSGNSRSCQRPPTTPKAFARTSTALHREDHHHTGAIPAPVTKYEMERRQHAQATDLFAEMTSSAAERRRRRHSIVEERILEQHRSPKSSEVKTASSGKDWREMASFDDSFTDLIRHRRANLDD